jgi:regulator of replication initiation timing
MLADAESGRLRAQLRALEVENAKLRAENDALRKERDVLLNEKDRRRQSTARAFLCVYNRYCGFLCSYE